MTRNDLNATHVRLKQALLVCPLRSHGPHGFGGGGGFIESKKRWIGKDDTRFYSKQTLKERRVRDKSFKSLMSNIEAVHKNVGRSAVRMRWYQYLKLRKRWVLKL